MKYSAEEYQEAQKWIDHKFRGSTIYEGHPIPVIEHALTIALAFADVSKEERLQCLEQLNDFMASGQDVGWEEAVNVIAPHKDLLRTLLTIGDE